MVFSNILCSEILFNFEVSLCTYDFGEVNDIRLIDIDNDNVDEFCVQYENDEFIRQVIYDCYGDTLKIFECINTTYNANSICKFNNHIYYLEVNFLGLQYQSYPHISIFDYNNAFIDSISLTYQMTQVSNLNTYDSEVKKISFVDQNMDLAMLIGFERNFYGGTQEFIDTRALHLNFENNELSYVTDYPAVSISENINNSIILTNGYDEYNIGSSSGRSIDLRIVNIETNSWQLFYECSGWYGISNPNPSWVYSFRIISYYTNNEDIIFAHKTYSNGNYFMNFISKDINTFGNEWEVIESFTDDIVSSTILNHPDGEHYLLYFFPTIACLRNVDTGNLYYQEISPITPQYILDNQSNEKLFFQVLNNAIIVYTIDPDITVGTDNEYIIGNKLLLNNYPNPFNPSTTISFSISTEMAKNAGLIIYNVKGQKVKTFPINPLTVQPINSVTWDGTDNSGKPVSSGIYLYKLIVNGRTEAMRKCLLLK